MQAEKQANRFSASSVWQVASYVAVATLAAIVTSAYYMATPGTQIADAYVRLNPGAALLHSNTTVRLQGRVPPEREQQIMDSIAGSGSTKAAAAAADDDDATPAAEPDEEEGNTQDATSPSAAGAPSAAAAEKEEEKEDDPGYTSLEKHSICNFLASGRQNPVSELSWGDIKDFCNVSMAALQLGRVGANCYRCTDGANVCSQRPRVLYHQYLRTLHPHRWRGNLLSMQAYLMTQDLRHSELWVWTDQISNLYNSQTAPFFDAFKANIKIKVFDHARLVVGTPWEDDPFLKNGTLVTKYMPNMGAYSDLVRLMLLWHHGGFWMDNDVLLLRDLHPLLAVSYQFIMRWTNAHCMLMFKGSLLLRKLMELARQLPLNHPKFKEDVIEKICKPVGYFAVAPGEYENTDVYNSCLFRILRRNHNTFAPPDLMYELPLSWFDQEWPGCQGGRENVTDARWRELASNHLAMHTRYPKDANYEGDGATPRTNRLIDKFFLQCSHAGCVPQEGRDLLAYDGMR